VERTLRSRTDTSERPLKRLYVGGGGIMITDRQISLIVAMKDYFGLLPGETLSGFMDETKKLTDADKAEFKTALTKIGYQIA
jgi:hypothetical protein